MSNPSKQRGTRFEVAARDWITDQTGWVAKRLGLAGTRDEGDLWVPSADLVVSCKAVRTWRLSEWIEEARKQRDNAKAKRYALLIKRWGKGDPAHSYVVMDGQTFLELLREAAS